MTVYLCDECLKPLDGEYETLTIGIILPAPCDICGEKAMGKYVRDATAQAALNHREIMVPLSLFKGLSDDILRRWELVRKSKLPGSSRAATELLELADVLENICTIQVNQRDDAFWRKMRANEDREENT